MKKRAIIDTYETLYQVDIVVANRYVKLDKLKKLYKYSDNVELDDYMTDAMATTAIVRRKEDNKLCILIKDNRDSTIKSIDKKVDRINTIAHESLHAVLDICDIIEQKPNRESSEHLCYLIGYIAECVYKTLTK